MVVGAALVVAGDVAAGAGADGGAGVVACWVVDLFCDGGELPSGSWYWLSPALPPARAADGSASARQAAPIAARRRVNIRHSYHDSSLIQRIVLGCAAAAAIVVLAIWLHSTQLENKANDFRARSSASVPSGVRYVTGLYQRAAQNNPDTRPTVEEATILIFAGQRARAARLLQGVLRDEPKNVAAWAQLSVATRDLDPRLSAAAAARVRELAPRPGG